jgi:lipoprotein-releasing system ATP-binding protein
MSEVSLGTPIMEAVGISKTFAHRHGELRILRNIDLKMFAGESVCITGSSGAGKSTLLHILGTLDRPTTGKLFFLGQDLAKKNDEDLAQFRGAQMGFVFQFHHLLSELTAIENVMVPLRLVGQSVEQAWPLAEKWLKDLGLGGRLQHFPSELSGGEQQRVALARALVRNPKILFADEPTGNLDSASGQNVQEILFQLRRELNITLVVVTHDQKFASRFSRRLILSDGSFRAAQIF